MENCQVPAAPGVSGPPTRPRPYRVEPCARAAAQPAAQAPAPTLLLATAAPARVGGGVGKAVAAEEGLCGCPSKLKASAEHDSFF